MPNEYLSLCSSRLMALRRQNDEVVGEIRCRIEREEASAEAPGAGEGEAAGGGEVHELRAKLLRQTSQSLPGSEVLLSR